MNLSRRHFAKFIGLAQVAAPLAARAATEKAMGDLIGLAAIPSGAPMPGISGGAPQSPDDWKRKVLRFVTKPFLPDWFDAELVARNKYVGYLDTDIACKRSWSMAVKIATQRQRNIERDRRNALEGPMRGLRQREFEEKFGIWL